MAYRIDYTRPAVQHLGTLTAAQRSLVLDAVEKQLTQQPTVETRNRKPMRCNRLAPWELRIRNLRVFYDVREDPDPLVSVVAVGIKEGNRVLIAGREFDL